MICLKNAGIVFCIYYKICAEMSQSRWIKPIFLLIAEDRAGTFNDILILFFYGGEAGAIRLWLGMSQLSHSTDYEAF